MSDFICSAKNSHELTRSESVIRLLFIVHRKQVYKTTATGLVHLPGRLVVCSDFSVIKKSVPFFLTLPVKSQTESG